MRAKSHTKDFSYAERAHDLGPPKMYIATSCAPSGSTTTAISTALFRDPVHHRVYIADGPTPRSHSSRLGLPVAGFSGIGGHRGVPHDRGGTLVAGWPEEGSGR